MNDRAEHRLEGLEPDNLLAFMALLGLLRVLEEARPEWHPRVSWTVDDPPVRPALNVFEAVDEVGVAKAAAEGLEQLMRDHEFEDLKDVKMSPEQAAKHLRDAAESADERRYPADMWAALVSDAVIDDRKGRPTTKPTPLCLLGAGRTSFLKNFASVPRRKTPPKRQVDGLRVFVSETDCLREALFSTWKRLDRTSGTPKEKVGTFRWDPNEDARHALRWTAPTDLKEGTQHGANRLAAIGLSALTVVPRIRFGRVQLSLLGGEHRPSGFTLTWPIWREPISLACIRALLGHPHLDRSEIREALGIVERRWVRRIAHVRYPSVTRGQPEPTR